MTCRDIEPLIQAERDGALSVDQRAVLSAHVAACPSCQEFQTALGQTMDLFAAENRSGRVPEVDAAWRDVRAQRNAGSRHEPKNRVTPVIWLGAPLAAAAAVAVAFLGLGSPDTPLPSPLATVPEVATEAARADFVEAGDANASTMVYVDKDSGWLVVWADMPATAPRG